MIVELAVDPLKHPEQLSHVVLGDVLLAVTCCLGVVLARNRDALG
jgi:hypothetical protein